VPRVGRPPDRRPRRSQGLRGTGAEGPRGLAPRALRGFGSSVPGCAGSQGSRSRGCWVRAIGTSRAAARPSSSGDRDAIVGPMAEEGVAPLGVARVERRRGRRAGRGARAPPERRVPRVGARRRDRAATGAPGRLPGGLGRAPVHEHGPGRERGPGRAPPRAGEGDVSGARFVRTAHGG
jgi:hypothetical protein